MTFRNVLLMAATLALLPAGCLLPARGHDPILLGADWTHAESQASAWASSSAIRAYQTQDLDRTGRRTYPVFDSLMLAEIYRRVGHLPEKLSHFPPAPMDEGRVCRENYIFYLRGDQIVGVEYREILSNGRGGYRQADDAVGELPGAVTTSW